VKEKNNTTESKNIEINQSTGGEQKVQEGQELEQGNDKSVDNQTQEQE